MTSITTRQNEYTTVELPFLNQLRLMGWEVIEGDVDVPDFTERGSFRDVLLTGRLREAIRRINVDGQGRPWLDDGRVSEAAGEMERLAGRSNLVEINQRATELLLGGTNVESDPELHGGRDQTVHFIDWDQPENNDFLAINQFRVDPPWMVSGKRGIIPDIVLFVNGIPLVVVECKSPGLTDPIGEAINQLLRYSNQREWVEEVEGAERLFHYNQFLVATCFEIAEVGTIGASSAHYVQWKDTAPVPQAEVAAELGEERLKSQQLLVAGMLRRAHLLDIVRNFTLFQQQSGKTVKIVGRYQQYRAVQLAIERLQTEKTRAEDGEYDRRGGIIWHTQGSGKSLTMVFLVRKMRTVPDLRGFKIVVVTDRTALEQQLRETAMLTGESIVKVPNTKRLQTVLRGSGPEIVFAMIQKYQQRDDETAEVIEFPSDRAEQRQAAEEPATFDAEEEEKFPVLNESERILVLVDEAHRSQSSELHANLIAALPNAAKIGFTGTPIIIGESKHTDKIFGSYIDRYTIRQSEEDGVTVPIKYMGRTTEAVIADGRTLDEAFADMFRDHTPEEIEVIRAKYATQGDVLEAESLIAAKARDMLRLYVEYALPDRFKAQIVATSRLAAIRYQKAITEAILELIAELEKLPPLLLELSPEEMEQRDGDTRFLVNAHAHMDTIRRLHAAAIISGDHNQPRSYEQWTDKAKHNQYIADFKRPLVNEADPDNQSGLAFLCVKSMLLTGFDAEFNQIIFLDRMMRGHELLQAIARVNRTSDGKDFGLVVDYFGVANHLQEALDIYSASDLQGALTSIKEEAQTLDIRHRRVLDLFQGRGIPSIHGDANVERCVQLLTDDVKLRAEFTVKLRAFLKSLGMVLPQPEGLRYTRDARQLAWIRNRAAKRSRDDSLNVSDASQKVQRLIDQYIEAKGVDPRVPPTQITAREFDVEIARLPSARAKASEMEHAARYHIRTHINEDPAYYGKLSDRLGEILQQFEENWEQLALHIQTDIVDEVRRGRREDESGLDPSTEAPFYDMLVEECTYNDELSPSDKDQLKQVTIEMVDHVREEIQVVDFWRNQHRQELLRRWIVNQLDQRDLVELDRQAEVADRIVQLARNRHQALTG